jgi:mannose-6-phosphate isomerase-like protein (cupin superfamily)
MKIHDFDALENDEVNSSYLRKAVYGESLSLAKVEVNQGETTQTHSHDTEEMVFVLSGEWLFRFPDGDVVVKANQMLEIPPGVEHSSIVLEDVVALDICAKHRPDWISGQDKVLHTNPDQTLWGV